MNTIPEELYNKIKKLSDQVRNELKTKGLVVPIQNDDGTTTIGKYTILKEFDGCYSILDNWDDTVVTGINLPQTAIIIANRLALNHYRDDKLIEIDRQYGYANFEEALYKRGMQKNSDKFDIYLSKYNQANNKKKSNKTYIVHSFQKLIKLV
jgi:hypothetical protein